MSRRAPRKRTSRRKLWPDVRAIRRLAGAFAAIAWAALSWRDASLCRPPPAYPVVAGGAHEPEEVPLLLTPVPVATDAGRTHMPGGARGGPRPIDGQQRPPCPRKTVDINGGCWMLAGHDPPCAWPATQWEGKCWLRVPERPSGPPVTIDPE